MIKEEYIMLRDEILKASDMVKKYRLTMYTLTAALLTFAFNQNEPILFLIPFIAIIPLYLMAMHLVDSTMRIGAYLYVFLETNPECDIKWETRLYAYDLKHKNEYSTKNTSISPYVVVSLCCIFLSFINMDFSNIFCFDFLWRLALQIILLVICLFIFIKKQTDYLKSKEKYINEWTSIKDKEDKKK